MEVGKRYTKKEVSELNHELFSKGREIIKRSADNDPTSCWHIGWHDFGKFIDYLEQNYEIKRKSR